MNHCFDCNSAYSEPGTCNCFAPGGKRAAVVTITPGLAPDDQTAAPSGWKISYYSCPGCGAMYRAGTPHVCMGGGVVSTPPHGGYVWSAALPQS